MKATVLLLQRMCEFRNLLEIERLDDTSLDHVLDQLRPLFYEVDAGRITPPAFGRMRSVFHMDDLRHGRDSALYNSEARCRSALEDWPSQPWFQAIRSGKTPDGGD